MVRINRLLGAALLVCALRLSAQSQPDLSAILDRLDRLERENRALNERVQTLQSRLDPLGDTKTAPPSATETVPGAGTTADAAPPPTLEQTVEIQGKRIDEQAQTK